jgi:hypothetical protein
MDVLAGVHVWGHPGVVQWLVNMLSNCTASCFSPAQLPLKH